MRFSIRLPNGRKVSISIARNVLIHAGEPESWKVHRTTNRDALGEIGTVYKNRDGSYSTSYYLSGRNNDRHATLETAAEFLTFDFFGKEFKPLWSSGQINEFFSEIGL